MWSQFRTSVRLDGTPCREASGSRVKCEVCGWATKVQIWVRPRSGGSKEIVALCCESCEEQKFARGFVEDYVVRGWDVFRLSDK